VVEYAILIAGASFGTITATVNAFLLRIDWGAVSYVLLGLLVLRIVVWVFTRRVQ
jgi:uncharacterized ion transporter superfamily protein YfcC